MLPSRFRVCLGKVHFPEVKMVNFRFSSLSLPVSLVEIVFDVWGEESEV